MKSFYDACSYMYEDNYSVALDYWKKAEDKDPENPNVWYNMGVCLKNSSKDRELAVEYLTKALDFTNPNYVRSDHTERTVPIDCYLELGIALRMVGKYDESTEMLNRAKEVAATNGRADLTEKTADELAITENAQKIKTQKSCGRIELYNLGSVINSEYSDHSPIITCDGQTLYFTSKRPNILNSEEDEKIYVAHKKDNGEWSSPEMLPAPINTKGKNESVVSVSSDGNQLYFFRSGSALQGGLFVSEKTDNGAWGKPKQLNSDINTKYRESHVAIAPDGNSMYFTSDRPGGFGGLDIYVIKKLPNGKWSEPQLLPAEVNTPKDEEYPFVHPNGSTLYFNSKGHENSGGYDVFFSKINDDGSYSKAENMCSPINTHDNDICYSLSCDGKTAYIAAIREDTKGEYDIYVINDVTTEENLIVYTGKVRYADNAIPKGVSVWVKDKTTGEDLGSYDVDENGEYLCYLQPKDDYTLTFSKDGETLQENSKTPTKEDEESFKRVGAPVALDDVVLPLLNKEADVAVAEGGLTNHGAEALDDVLKTVKDMKDESREMVVNIEHNENEIPRDSKQMKSVLDYLSGTVNSSDITYNNKPSDKNVYNVKVSYGDMAGNDLYGGQKNNLSDTVEICNIYFDFDKSDITDKYKETLDKLSEYMKDNPGCKIEIGGHTDNVGSDDYNMLLSGRRARAVKDYLVAKGVKQDKVIEKKYGEGSPIASNNTSSTRKYNRRVAFKVLEQGSEKYLKVVE
ncbi:MAG: PD40 domain-containing protein [Bacteroidales bacterium]|nr:PD40 domain-containing protein [Bacteroidales bacterium]MBQ1732367.1 PD40 domain-containing protein [Bacteroidales bacterium]MBQ6278055.1 PD40 domain-containing protein [Bacteroidales bacterium]MBR6066383.1 PD40 domain-containing protein [Bacteroidales bacterium]